MKLIQAMKRIKDQLEKANDLRSKVSKFCADLSYETPTYGANQREQVSAWIDAHHDIVKDVERLRVAVQRTNMATDVSIDIDGHTVTKSLAAWIHRRRDLAKLEQTMWGQLGDRGLKESRVASTTGGPALEVTIRRYFDPPSRDAKQELYRSEPSLIDGHLEIVNATTDLIEA